MFVKIGQGIVIGAVAAALAYGCWVSGVLDAWEHATWTWRIQQRAQPSPATEDIKIIVLDQSSLDWAARESRLPWPWPREVYAPLLDYCYKGGAHAMAFDVLFLEPSFWGVEDDELLGSAIRESAPFTVGAFLGEELGAVTNWPSAIPSSVLNIDGLEEWLARVNPSGVVMSRAAMPIPEIGTNTITVGDVKGAPDDDGLIRRAHVFRVFDGQAVPSLGLSAYAAAYQARHGKPLTGRIEGNTLWIGKRQIPMDNQGRTILRYPGPSGTHQVFTAAEVIQSSLRLQEGEMPAVSPIVFQDRYVFFGFSAPGLMDLRPTPLSPVTPGVEVHATILDNFLANDFIREMPMRRSVLIMISLALVAGVVARLSGRAWHSVVAFAVLLPLPWGLGLLFYDLSLLRWDFSCWWPVVPHTLAVGLSLLGAVLVNYATEGRQKAFIKSAFKHYLSPAVIDQIVQNPDQLKLGGERRELSILFSDLQGFSTISENMEPQDLTRLLNDYLSDMTDIILEEGGTLDKYEGDAIIAFWNAPLTQPDHAARACRAALRCQRKLAARRDEFKARTGVELHMRIGVHTGVVVVGNMGSRERFDYTVLGDAANLAARLEGANKAFGTFTMISEPAWEQAGDAVTGREIGLVRVVGRKSPVRVFEAAAMEGESTENPWPLFNEAVAYCAASQWKEALALFKQWPDDALAKKYAARCEALLAGQETGWDGTWNLTEK
jgi:adenylate cyclase